jgi:hypothetical protein
MERASVGEHYPNGRAQHRKPAVVPTERQKRLAVLALANKASERPVPMTEIVQSAGYAVGVAPNQSVVRAGTREAMRELGLTEELISSSLVDDIIAKPGKRIQELRTGAELLGMLKRDDDTPPDRTNATYNFLFNETTKEDIRTIEEKIKARLMGQMQHDTDTTTP